MYTIYTQKYCGYCFKAKELMKEHNCEFMEISLDHDDQARVLLKEQGLKTVPQIYDEGNNHIGGYTDLLKTFKKVG